MYLVEQGRKHFEEKCEKEGIDTMLLSFSSRLYHDTPKRERLRKDREAYKDQIESAKAAGKAEVYQEVAAWDKRRKESEAQGVPFTEPPPTKKQEKSQ